ncbi:hypothetical protein [Chitinophaga sp. LS1]|uniref:hypothetical protein n=1 Tax=Chitinophaga sp. LS1 TaxID=3051176 RepID=UPI002AAABD04|nr:hypothetical protein [Chitinophaga sp. LS1]WPV64826.1 hypothetical protein QQL36_23775 [Chitinophaga sp. LS1]
MIANVKTQSTTALSERSMQEFLHKASLIGHDHEPLLSGEEITTYFHLHDFNIARQVLSNATDEQHRLRLPTFYSAAHELRTKLGQGKHDRGEAVLFAGAPISEKDAKGINRHFPLCLKGISVLHKVVPKGETWDLTMPQEIWNLGEMEELYTIVNIGTLVLEEGAKVVIRGNVFSLLCQRFITLGNAGADIDYQVGIMPTPFSVDFGHGPQNGIHGENGSGGLHGRNGIQGIAEASILGRWIPNQPLNELHGADATDAENGTDGGKGRNGGMCKLAEITIRELEGRLHLFSQAGAGGAGGDGSDGGHGGNGGNGAPGLDGFNMKVPAGNGGRGGNAGHGGISSNIYLNVPEEAVGHVRMTAFCSLGGIGGKGGKGGLGGKGGTVVPMTDATLNGVPGTNGHHGIPGKNGLHGRGRHAAVCYLNDHKYHSSFSLPKHYTL